MKKIEMPLGKKQQIVEDYQNKDIKVSEILEKYGISNGVLNRLVKELNVPLREPKKGGKRTNIKLRRCVNCNRTITDNHYKFCPFCGHDVRLVESVLIDELGDLWTMCSEGIGRNYRDNVYKIVTDISNYLEKIIKEKTNND